MSTCDCPSCGSPLVLHGHNGAAAVSPQHFQHDGYWFCNEKCCEDFLRKLANGGYDPHADPDIGDMA